MTQQAPDIDPEGRHYEAYISFYEGYADIVHNIALGLYMKINELDLPMNQNCQQFILDIFECGFFYEPVISEPFKRSMEFDRLPPLDWEPEYDVCEDDDDELTNENVSSVDGIMKSAAARKAEMEAQGFNGRANQALIESLMRKHFSDIIEIVRGAAQQALMDPECGVYGPEEKVGDVSVTERYDRLVFSMTQELGDDIAKQINLIHRGDLAAAMNREIRFTPRIS